MKIIDRTFLDVDTRTCHASTSVFNPRSQKQIFAWFGGGREGDPDSSIYVQYDDEVISLGCNKPVAYWNPVLFNVNDRVYLSYKVGIFCDRWQSYLIELTDALPDFATLTCLDNLVVHTIPAGLNFCVKTKPVIERGYIYCGSSVETSFDWTSYIEKYAFDHGAFSFLERSAPLTVEKKEVVVGRNRYSGAVVKKISQGIIQPAIWLDDSGNKHAFFRSSRGLGQVYYSRTDPSSYVACEVWTDPKPILHLKNPNASVDVVYTTSGRLFLVHNPSSTHRFPLDVSELNPSSFEILSSITIQEKPEEGYFSPEFSYPYMIEKDGVLHLTYTHQRTQIEHVQIEVD